MEGIKLQKSHEHLHNKLDVLFCMLHRIQSKPRVVGSEEMETTLTHFQSITTPIEPPKLDPNWKATDQYGKQKAEEIKKKIEESA